MFNNIGSFNGRSRVNRMNLVQDHVEDRQQSIAKARQAREERERAQKRRRAGQVILRAFRSFMARRELERRAYAVLTSQLTAAGRRPHLKTLFTMAFFAKGMKQPVASHEDSIPTASQVFRCIIGTTNEDDAKAVDGGMTLVLRNDVLSHSSARKGLLWAAFGVFSSVRELVRLFGGGDVASATSLWRAIHWISSNCQLNFATTSSGNEEEDDDDAKKIHHERSSSHFAAQWMSVLCRGIRVIDDALVSNNSKAVNTNDADRSVLTSLRARLIVLIRDALRCCRVLPVDSPVSLMQLLLLPCFDCNSHSSTGSATSSGGASEPSSPLNDDEAANENWNGTLIKILFGKQQRSSAVGHHRRNADDRDITQTESPKTMKRSMEEEEAETVAAMSSLLTAVSTLLASTSSNSNNTALVADSSSSLSSSSFHITPENRPLLCNAFHRLSQLCAIVPLHLAGLLASTLNLVLEHLTVAIVSDEVSCSAVIASASDLFEPTKGLRLLRLVSSTTASLPPHHHTFSEGTPSSPPACSIPPEAYHAITSLLSTPSTLAQILGDESDRSLMISCHSRLLKTQTLDDLTAGFVIGSGIASSLGTASTKESLWLAREIPVLSLRSTGCPSLFLQMFSYYVDSGMFIKGILAAGGGATPSSHHHYHHDTSRTDDSAVASRHHHHRLNKREMARLVVLTLRDLVVRAHLHGCDSFQTEVIATRCCVLFSKLFVINELHPFCEEKDWWCPGTFSPAMVEHHWHASLEEDDDDDEITGDAVVLNSALQVASRRAAIKHQLRKNYFAGSKRWGSEVRLVAMLRNAPFLVPFESRVAIFSRILHPREEARVSYNQRMALTVRRGCVFEDAFLQFKRQSGFGVLSGLRGGLNPQFVNEAGFGDGVYRDFMQCLCAEGFSPEHGLFRRTDEGGYLFPNPASETATDAEHLNRFRFLGAMVGKALYDGILLSVPFSLHFRNALLGRRNTFDHLIAFDPHLYRQLSQIRDADSETIDDLGLTFTATVDAFGAAVEVPLVANGNDILVTASNVAQYVQLYADFRLNRENERQTKAFQTGLHDVVESTALQIFGSNGLDILFQGDSGIDADDWEQNTVYSPADAKDAPVVQYFWQLVRNMTNSERQVLLGFVTSARRAPLLGFRHMVPKFTIAVTQTSVDHLPSAATCFCQLKIPSYTSFAETRDKLMQAMAHGQTFELS
ncbi:ubiquitin-protein ligase, putative [Bodo saltans]|uniref:HECT-type E3 ubiquitin transferase n=1 Tax=Bodo saltans TaxID=75058 RepID=A0A0S4J6M3_BODSA|nr:ubiquitin-protein ligase, putative [Bodo saltans]|eukprot:CUG69073.1 ubiquitin-protein ligase, putative [Bodo saltans]